jgi:hypothetical protein
MELFETLLVTFFAGGAPGAIWTVLRFILRLLVNISEISDKMQVSALDRYLARSGWCSSRAFDFSGMPGNGIHVLITRPVFWPTGILVAYKGKDDDDYKKVSKYWIYSFGPGTEEIKRLIIGNPNAITIRNVYIPSPWRTSIDISYTMPPSKEKPWQTTVINQIMSAYATTGRASFLVCGLPGCGKSTLGELVGKRLKGIGVIPEVVKNIDLTTPNLLLEDAFSKPTPSTPIILMLDEFDGAVKYAERDTAKDKAGNGREAICLANTPTLLLSTLDQLARTQNLIVIATSNLPLEKMRGDIYTRYTRIGRLDRWYSVPSKKSGTKSL